MPSTVTLDNSIQYVRRFVHRAPQIFSGDLSPAVPSADWVRQFLLSPPFAWRWNRARTAFLLKTGVQDYTLMNWAPSKQVQLGWIYVDPNGNEQQVVTAGTTGLTAPAWSTGNTTDGSVTWTNRGSVGLNTPLVNFGWLEKAVAATNGQSLNATGVRELSVKLTLSPDSNQAPGGFISAYFDDNAGDITFRITPIPDQDYTATIEYQMAAPSFTGTPQTWAPIPDYFSFLVNQGFLAKTYEAIDDPRYLPAMQLFVRQTMSVAQGLTDSQKNIFLSSFLDTQRESQGALADDQLGRAGRSLS